MMVCMYLIGMHLAQLHENGPRVILCPPAQHHPRQPAVLQELTEGIKIGPNAYAGNDLQDPLTTSSAPSCNRQVKFKEQQAGLGTQVLKGFEFSLHRHAGFCRVISAARGRQLDDNTLYMSAFGRQETH